MVEDNEYYYRNPSPEPDNTFTAMRVDPQIPSCDGYNNGSHNPTIEGTRTSSHRRGSTSMTAPEASINPNRGSVSRSPSQASSDSLDELPDDDLEHLAERAGPEIRSLLASLREETASLRGKNRTTGTKRPSTIHRTRQLSEEESLTRLTNAAMAAGKRRMVKELGIPEEDLQALIGSLSPVRP
jgi:hypothetical protein